jgi:hypothetical protein
MITKEIILTTLTLGLVQIYNLLKSRNLQLVKIHSNCKSEIKK